mmetsp:Transcript_4480/g.5728  ORF Transcript_4480/g.5728 Transcript_4480/m.5728 type:complete len:232 (-) Transcript_4480:294-989(-)
MSNPTCQSTCTKLSTETPDKKWMRGRRHSSPMTQAPPEYPFVGTGPDSQLCKLPGHHPPLPTPRALPLTHSRFGHLTLSLPSTRPPSLLNPHPHSNYQSSRYTNPITSHCSRPTLRTSQSAGPRPQHAPHHHRHRRRHHLLSLSRVSRNTHRPTRDASWLVTRECGRLRPRPRILPRRMERAHGRNTVRTIAVPTTNDETRVFANRDTVLILKINTVTKGRRRRRMLMTRR